MLRHITAPGGVTVFTKRVVRYLLTHPDGIEYHLLYSDPSQQEVLGDLPARHVVLADACPSPLGSGHRAFATPNEMAFRSCSTPSSRFRSPAECRP